MEEKQAQQGVLEQTHTKTRTPPPYKVILHNDDVNDMLYVVDTIFRLTPLSAEQAYRKMLEAHKTGLAVLLVCHKERAELYQEQFHSCGLTVTIEPE
jgi:ATP-dependent Clp protease adaptor protein ClpS